MLAVWIAVLAGATETAIAQVTARPLVEPLATTTDELFSGSVLPTSATAGEVQAPHPHAAAAKIWSRDREGAVVSNDLPPLPDGRGSNLRSHDPVVSNGGKVVWHDGLYFEHPDTLTKIHLGGLIQQDWVFFGQSQSLLNDPTIGDLQDGVFFRRARFKFDGTAYGILEWDMDAELLADERVTFDGLWIGLKQVPVVGHVRVGHLKIPQGLESVTSNRVSTFTERATIFDAFFREFGPGVQAFDQFWDNNATWDVCFHRIDFEGDGIDTADGEYAATGRLTFIPYSEEHDRRLLHLGGSASFRDSKFEAAENEKIIRLRSRPEVRDARLLPFFVDTEAIVADSNTVLGAEAAWVDGPFSLQAEYVASLVSDPTDGGLTGDDAWFHGYYIQASYFLTGEHRVYDRHHGRFARVIPHTSAWTIDPTSHAHQPRVSWGSGAWEVAARYSRVNLNDADIRGGRLSDVTLGVNWYLNANFRIQWNYLYSDRDVSAPRNDGTAHAFVMRFSLDL